MVVDILIRINYIFYREGVALTGGMGPDIADRGN